MPLLDHLIELRRRLLWTAVVFLVSFLVCYYFSRNIYNFLAQPLATAMAQYSGGNRSLIYTHLTEAFFTFLRVAFFGAAFISFPMTATQLWLFIAPGLYRSEKRAIAALPGGDAGAVPDGRGAGVLLRVSVRLEVLPELPDAARRRRACRSS